jgi:hypothetical protein
MTAPDINAIVKDRGIEAGRAVIDGAAPWKPDGDAFFRDLLDDVVGRHSRKPIDLEPRRATSRR